MISKPELHEINVACPSIVYLFEKLSTIYIAVRLLFVMNSRGFSLYWPMNVLAMYFLLQFIPLFVTVVVPNDLL